MNKKQALEYAARHMLGYLDMDDNFEDSVFNDDNLTTADAKMVVRALHALRRAIAKYLPPPPPVDRARVEPVNNTSCVTYDPPTVQTFPPGHMGFPSKPEESLPENPDPSVSDGYMVQDGF